LFLFIGDLLNNYLFSKQHLNHASNNFFNWTSHSPIQFGPLDSVCNFEDSADSADSAECPSLRCDFLLPNTPYREIREKKIPPLPEAFIYDRAATSGTCEM
jgi:hypothetical protein